MKRFIVLTFLLLGWVFWEMSGGADFEPRRMAEAPQTSPSETAEPTPIFVAAAPDTLVTRTRATPGGKPQVRRGTTLSGSEDGLVSNDPAKAGLFAPADEEEDLAEPEIALASLSEDDSAFSGTLTTGGLNTGGLTLSANSAAVDAAVEQVLATPQAAPEPALPIAVVSGSTVNMRGGPGTEYEVLTQLRRGDTVEIVADPGTGWLKLRALRGGPTGWMSASLVDIAN